MTAADRLLSLSGLTGAASVLLLAIGSGATTGEALADYSGLESGTSAEHILVDRSKGAADYELTKKRKKNIVNIDGVLYEFATEKEAISFISQQVDKPVIEKEAPKPIRTVSIAQVETAVKSSAIPETSREIYNHIQFADYAAILKAYDYWLELDEEEALLLLI